MVWVFFTLGLWEFNHRLFYILVLLASDIVAKSKQNYKVGELSYFCSVLYSYFIYHQ